MPSDLQRVAQGLVECLDEVPQVVIQLQRTAERCRESAALAMAASQGRATVAAQQLDAAARSCEAAAHYLSMAPPKAKAWAERLVGGSQSTDRPDAGSADRNKATGGAGDVADRDVFGRIKRTSLPFKPAEDAEGKEPPVIKVARKALQKLRKQQQKDDEEREQHEPLEVGIVVVAGGKAEVVDERDDAERDFEIKVELDDAATELLKAMEEHGKRNWREASLTIDQDRVTATFTYDDMPGLSRPPVIDVELPEPPSSDR
jgi:preprotein translocase subunit YajC